ncbi:unnamed protein product [Heligmosomoides polygyrus]|uniref:Acyl-CoA synthetase n=1 Tax=Heligmosomoides polygyrus TaxID=6339 RepID=A0A183F435_HELPZ|nr:unnamed protein product [Heligmosomoides polygyrus]
MTQPLASPALIFGHIATCPGELRSDELPTCSDPADSFAARLGGARTAPRGAAAFEPEKAGPPGDWSKFRGQAPVAPQGRPLTVDGEDEYWLR